MVVQAGRLDRDSGEIMRSMLFAAFLWLAVPCIAEAAPKQPAELVGTHGYVHMSFSKGGAGALFVSPEGGGREVRIDAFAPVPPLANIQSIGGWLPPGRYRIARWGMLEWKDGPVFEVQPCRATDLGDFIGVNVGGYKMVLMPITDPDHRGALEAAVAPFASLLKNPTPLRLNQIPCRRRCRWASHRLALGWLPTCCLRTTASSTNRPRSVRWYRRRVRQSSYD